MQNAKDFMLRGHKSRQMRQVLLASRTKCGDTVSSKGIKSLLPSSVGFKLKWAFSDDLRIMIQKFGGCHPEPPR